MPLITNEAVIGSGYVTSRNARPQLLGNDWIVAAVYNSSASRLQFRVKKTSGGAWEDLAFYTVSGLMSWSLAIKGTRVFATFHTTVSTSTRLLNFEATTVSNGATLSAVVIDNTSSSGDFSGEDLRINDAGTELHHAFSAKTSTYPNSFNIRYLKGTIATDGAVTWTATEQVTTENTSGRDYKNPSVSLPNGKLRISTENFDSVSHTIRVYRKPDTSWFNSSVYSINNSSYTQSYSIMLFVPFELNNIPNGRLWNVWQGKDPTDSSKFNIRTSYSDDEGVTWSTPVKQTTGNVYDQTNAQLTADKTGKVFLVWDSQEDRAGTPVTVTAYKIWLMNAMWGSRQTYAGDNYTGAVAISNKDYTLRMTKPAVIRQYSGGVVFDGEYYTGATVSPVSGPLGNKTSPSITSYTVTPEAGSTITSIVEKVNGTTLNTYSNPASLSRTFVIPLSNWDALPYWQTHTITIDVTDTNQVTFTATYTFVKALANDASLLEGAKAAKDSKDRISTKRDGIAGQVGLPPGSSFDAISAQLDAGTVFMKFATGTVVANSASPYNITVSGLSFRPKVVLWSNVSINTLGTWIDPSLTGATDKKFVARASTTANNSSYPGTDTEAIVIANGFTLATYQPGSFSYKWIAFG